MNANHKHKHALPHQPYYSAWLTTLGVVFHAHVALQKSFKTKVQGQS